MTKQELNSRQSSKYGKLIRIYDTHRIDTLFDRRELGIQYYMYKINSQYIMMFKQTRIYIKGENENDVCSQVCELLNRIKLF